MDRLPTSALVGSSAVPIAGLSAIQLLLPARAGVGPEFALHALVGRGVYAASLLRSAQDELLVAAVRSYGGSQARETIAASHGFDSDLPKTATSHFTMGNAFIRHWNIARPRPCTGRKNDTESN